jgi:hypothetical protein
VHGVILACHQYGNNKYEWHSCLRRASPDLEPMLQLHILKPMIARISYQHFAALPLQIYNIVFLQLLASLYKWKTLEERPSGPLDKITGFAFARMSKRKSSSTALPHD